MDIQKKDIPYWVGFSFITSIGHVRFSRLETHFGNLADAWKAEPTDLVRAGLDNTVVRSIMSWRSRIDLAAEMELKGIVKIMCNMKYVLVREARQGIQGES